jgi:DNA-binding transcriptional regulator LsrR (DeoR family)
MAESITAEQVVGAAKELGQDEFTRGDLAEKLGVKKPQIRKGFKDARQAGELDKVRDDAENTAYFKLTGSASR